MQVNERDILVALESHDPARRFLASDLAKHLGMAIVDLSHEHNTPLQKTFGGVLVAVRDDVVELRDLHTRPGRGVFVDFSTLSPKRTVRGFSRKQPLARAIGKYTMSVLDATAGLGHDAALLACMGFRVTAVERSPIIAALFEDGLRRAMLDDELHGAFRDRLQFIHADARDVVQSMTPMPDAVYIDSMFPSKRKASALAQKSIRLVRQIVGDDHDATELLAEARQHCARVIVKRPTYADPLAAKPTNSLGGKLVRYDVYVG